MRADKVKGAIVKTAVLMLVFAAAAAGVFL